MYRISVILKNNNPITYWISDEVYGDLFDYIEDLELAQLYREREHEKAEAIEVSLDEL